MIHLPVIQINLVIQLLFVWISTATARVYRHPRLSSRYQSFRFRRNYSCPNLVLLQPLCDELDEIITAWTMERDHYQVMHLVQAHGVPAGAVLNGSETIMDPHLAARGFWDLVDHSEVGVYKQTTTP